MTRTRSNRRLERPREQVLAATLEMVAEEGLAKVTMASLAARLGTSGGHLLYYFGTRNGLLLETLRWSESEYAAQRAPILEKVEQDGAGGVDALLSFTDVYLALDERDPRWLLWLELWARAPYDAELAAAQRAMDDDWHADLVRLFAAALPQVPGREALSERLRAMWDGFSIGIVTGGGTALRDHALEHTRAAVTGHEG
ncbi:TetR/AcrR family transcriptional regulator [Nocardioides sp.]|uniref:TetR/AcrR family transcriptional regulator n=1 Tax=Nocardioides sp. TaxID=35761 RepID=UPI0019ADF192|nr:TetR/AcrR family transcriptional regulator [Nocardioides sp.]MBC7275862.1 TetR family transcriptional regulator C-terminal domain-containing protein [Nocardioides sp.]